MEKMEKENPGRALEISQIKKLIQHRYPFLLIDRVLDYEETRKIKGIKNVTINEAFFSGHFPREPIMPGVLILESMAQLVAVLAGMQGGVRGYLTAVYKARFMKPVIPGDQLILEAEIIQRVRNLIRVKAVACVSDKIVAKSELGFILFTEGGLGRANQ